MDTISQAKEPSCRGGFGLSAPRGIPEMSATSKPGNEREMLLPVESLALHGEYRNYYLTKRNNYFASIQGLPELWDCFLRLDEIFTREFSDLERLRDTADFLPLQLFMSSHAKIRIACELAFASCVGEAWSIIRDAIDTAVVGHKIHREPHLGIVWRSKEDDAHAMKKWRAAFDSYKETTLFPAEHGLAELHEYYRAFSEGGTHASVTSMGLRFQQRADAEGMTFSHLYLE